jgi:hypothetical protein
LAVESAADFFGYDGRRPFGLGPAYLAHGKLNWSNSMIRIARLVVGLITMVMLVASASSAHAFRFGEDESIVFIQDVTLKGAKDEALFLAYKTTTQNLFGGLYVQDNGYVLGVKGDSKRYYQLPTGDELKDFQQRGLLPSPLPTYSLSFWDYLFGYSLWVMLVVVGVWSLFDIIRRRRKRESAMPPPADA